MATTLECYRCGATYETSHRKRCDCGEPLWFAMDTPYFEFPETDTKYGMWRYQRVLPTTTPVGVGGAAGGTPLVRTPRLDDLVGGSTVHVKDESENPTGSFKDRGSAVGISYAVENEIDWVGTLSYGNMAMSVSANAASAGLQCVVIVPSKIPDARFQAIGQYDPHIIRVDDFKSVNQCIVEIESKLDIEFINAEIPLRVEGQKTIAYEICEHHVPDAIVMPVASGGHASAMWKGLRELETIGLIDEPPRLYLVQAEASEPIARAFQNNKPEVVDVLTEDTLAVSIVNKSPLSGNRALAAARDTGGAVLSVSESALTAATAQMADYAGLCVEPASATTLAGARELAETGALSPHDDVVLVATGTGFKELAGVSSDITVETMDASTAQEQLEALTANGPGAADGIDP